jgi:hypothetical protein
MPTQIGVKLQTADRKSWIMQFHRGRLIDNVYLRDSDLSRSKTLYKAVLAARAERAAESVGITAKGRGA